MNLGRNHLSRLPISLLAVSLLAAAPVLAQPPTELFISEYVEGSSYNKAIEIFNGTGAAMVADLVESFVLGN